MSADWSTLSADELVAVAQSRSVIDSVLGARFPTDQRDNVVREVLVSVLSAYREARVAGVCHDGACELAVERSHAEASGALREV